MVYIAPEFRVSSEPEPPVAAELADFERQFDPGQEFDPAVLRQQVIDETARVRGEGADYYDRVRTLTPRIAAGGLSGSIASALFAGELMLVGNDIVQPSAVHAVATVSLMGVGLTSMAVSGGTSMDLRVLRRAHGQVPVLNHHAVEVLRADNAVGSLPAGSILTVVLPLASGRQADASNGENLAVFERLASDSGADGLLVPASLANSKRNSTAADSSLKDMVTRFKGDGLRMPESLASEGFLLLPAGKEADGQDAELETLLRALAEKFPAAGIVRSAPKTAADARTVARNLSGIARHQAAVYVDTERYVHRDEDGVPERRKQHFYTMPAPGDDVYTPAIFVHKVDNTEGTPPKRLTVESLAGPVREAIIDGQALPAAEVLPAAVAALRKLREIEQRLGEEGNDQPVVSQAGVTDRSFSPARIDRRNERWRRQFKAATGAIALMAAGLVAVSGLTYGVISQAHGEPVSSNGVKNMGAGLIPDAPTWKLEPNGLEPAGYYTDSLYSYLHTNLQWKRYEKTWPRETDMPEHIAPDTPHITVQGYFDPALTLTSEAGSGGPWFFLPEREGTDVAAVRVTYSDGKPVGHTVYTTEDNLTALVLDKMPDNMIHVSYDLAALASPAGVVRATSDMRIEGIVGQPVQANQDTTAAVGRAAGYIRAEFSYDNTAEVDSLVKSAAAAKDAAVTLHHDAYAARIANCNVAATVLAIGHEFVDADDRLAYASGYKYRPGDVYLHTRHGWLTDGKGSIIDGTPAPKGRTAAEAGVPPTDIKKLDKRWRNAQQQFAADRPVDVPWEALPPVGVATLGVLGWWRRAQYSFRGLQERLASRHLTAAQAEQVVAHRAFGGATDVPDLRTGGERLSVRSLPRDALQKIAADPRRAAPYLTRPQQRSLERHARLLLRQQ